MESQPNRNISSRKQPLSDCTNTVHHRPSTNYSSSSSSSSVLQKPFPVSFQLLNSDHNHASSSKLCIDKAQSTAGSTTGAVTKSRVSIPMSTVQGSLSIKTPVRSLPRPSSGVGGGVALKPSPVRVQSGSKRKDKENAIGLPSAKSHSRNNALIPPAVRESLFSTPALSLAKPSSDTGASDVLGSSPVYVQRQSGSKRKDKENAIDLPSAKSHSRNNALIPLSAVLRSSTSTPSRFLAKPSSDNGASDVLGSSSVYVRRQSGSKRKDKEMTFDMPATKIHSSSSYKMKKDGGIDLPKSLGVPSSKAKRVRKDVKHTLPKDFLEQQKAYFAEIDAFELSEEEVSSADELE
ncbi:hypothetical protein LINPERHAP2_LOCUS14466 [Linum perenne]